MPLASIGLAAGCGSAEPRPNVRLVTVDALRADHIGVYGFVGESDRLPERESNREMFERVAEKTTTQALAWLAQPRDRPFFLWVRYNDPHGPYTPPAGYQRGSPPTPDDDARLRALGYVVDRPAG